MVSILITLESVIDKLGGFLNPYLGDITELLVLFPVRLALPPLLKLYSGAVDAGDSSLAIAFENLRILLVGWIDHQLVVSMERFLISAYLLLIFAVITMLQLRTLIL